MANLKFNFGLAIDCIILRWEINGVQCLGLGHNWCPEFGIRRAQSCPVFGFGAQFKCPVYGVHFTSLKGEEVGEKQGERFTSLKGEKVEEK